MLHVEDNELTLPPPDSAQSTLPNNPIIIVRARRRVLYASFHSVDVVRSSRCLNPAKTLSTSPSSLSRLSVTKVSSSYRLITHFFLTALVLLEMVENMKRVASSDQELTVEERNLLSVAYKNVIGARRASWRIVSSIEQKEESKGNEAQVSMIKSYREKIESELAKICEDILDVLEKHLIPSAASGESKVFYHKM